MSKYNYGFLQRNSLDGPNILWLSIDAEDLAMADVLSHALTDSVWHWSNPPQATQLTIRHIVNRLERIGVSAVNAEMHMNSIDENHHTIHLVDFEMGRVMLIDDNFEGNYVDLMDYEVKIEFDLMRYVQRFLK